MCFGDFGPRFRVETIFLIGNNGPKEFARNLFGLNYLLLFDVNSRKNSFFDVPVMVCYKLMPFNLKSECF